MSDRTWHHYFHGEGIDMAKVHDEANTFMSDYKSPRSSIVHDHPHGASCENEDHTAYDQITRLSFPFTYDETSRRMFKELTGLEPPTAEDIMNEKPMGNGLRREKP